MLSSVMLGAGFGLAVASSAIGEKIDKGTPLLRPINPLLMNVTTGLAGIVGLVAVVGGFFLVGWTWLIIMLAGIAAAAILLAPFPRTPVLAIGTGVLGTALLVLGWIAA